jgi:hypothetical protein
MEEGNECNLDLKNTTKKTFYLSQSDFEQGTYIVKSAGRYVLTEDVSFNPNPRSAGGNNLPREDQFNTADPPGPYDRRAFGLGFFAAIVIQAAGVDIDLNGKTLEQSVEHALMQRFFAVIELANSPFVYDHGPHNFTSSRNLDSARLTRIHNGNLGRSSHHGIHGIGPVDLVVSNVNIYDFEVAGISINGGKNIVVDQVIVGPGRIDVPVVGLFSTGLFIKPYVEAIVNSKQSGCGSESSILLNQKSVPGKQILKELQDIIDDTYSAVVCGVGEVPHTVTNRQTVTTHPSLNYRRNGLPDGSAMYGMVFGAYGSHTQGIAPERNATTCLDGNGEVVGMVDKHDTIVWKRCEEQGATFRDTGNDNIKITNSRIQGIEIMVNEVEALRTKNFDKGVDNFRDQAQVDVVGAVYQYEANKDAPLGEHGNFVGNPISNAQPVAFSITFRSTFLQRQPLLDDISNSVDHCGEFKNELKLIVRA